MNGGTIKFVGLSNRRTIEPSDHRTLGLSIGSRILNEYIKSTIDQCIDIYVKLFNLVFDSGFFPECWTVGIIKPLYKHKGDTTNPENYRPITLLSSMGKVFTVILNRRLCINSEEYYIF